MRLIRAVPALLVAGLVSCERAQAPTVTVADSAGVLITLSRPSEAVFAVVDPTPVLSLGGREASGATQFFRVQSVHLDRADRLWVADGQSGELRIFEPDGRHRKTVGGSGSGPGEFQRIRLLGSYAGDSVLVADDADGRIAVFDEEGDLVRTLRLPSHDRAVSRAFESFPDGTVLGQIPRVLTTGSLVAGQILADTVRLVRIDLEGRGELGQATVPGPLWLWTGRSQVPVPFTVNTGFAVQDERIHLVSGSAFRVRVYEAGRLTEIYGVSRPERAVTPADVASVGESIEESVRASRRGDHLSALNHPARPTVMPAYWHVRVASDGNVWARIYAPDGLEAGVWDVFSSAREWLGEVETPEGFHPFVVTRDRLAGLWIDELGVEHVRVYGLIGR